MTFLEDDVMCNCQVTRDVCMSKLRLTLGVMMVAGPCNSAVYMAVHIHMQLSGYQRCVLVSKWRFILPFVHDQFGTTLQNI